MDDIKTISPTLIALAAELRDLADAVECDPETGEVVGMEEFDAAQAAFEDKAVAAAITIRGCDAYINGLDDYIADLQKRRKAAVGKRDSLKSYLVESMKKAGIKRLDRIEARLTLRDSESVEVTDEELIPTEYKKIKWEVSKTAIKKAIESGQDVTGARIVTKTGVIIK
jgi:hypothetical protein